jgi:3-hydroxybutyryl-CoA dehydrogenase
METRPMIAAIGAGRMGRGIAQVFAWAGFQVRVFDIKERSAEAHARLREDAAGEIKSTLTMLTGLGAGPEAATDTVLARISYFPAADIVALNACDYVFECVPERFADKQAAFALANPHFKRSAIITSTTSTILTDQLQSLVTEPSRFLNAHWLNPAFLVPLVEVSPGARTLPEVTQELCRLLKGIGKVPVVCKASPGFIVPRIQMLAMNEAVRLVEEGVATPEDIDKAVRYGFGLRFAVLGLIEFIDWGGADILAYASRYMSETMADSRFREPDLLAKLMAAGKTGMTAGEGIYDWRTRDVASFRNERLAAFLKLVQDAGCFRPPVLS